MIERDITIKTEIPNFFPECSNCRVAKEAIVGGIKEIGGVILENEIITIKVDCNFSRSTENKIDPNIEISDDSGAFFHDLKQAVCPGLKNKFKKR